MKQSTNIMKQLDNFMNRSAHILKQFPNILCTYCHTDRLTHTYIHTHTPILIYEGTYGVMNTVVGNGHCYQHTIHL